MPLVCSACGAHAFGDFVQISYRLDRQGHRRILSQRVNGLHVAEWEPLPPAHPFAGREAGIYCVKDGQPYLPDFLLEDEKKLLRDQRLPLPAADPETLVGELNALAQRLHSEVYHKIFPEEEGRFSSSCPLPAWMKETLASMGIRRLYAHQEEAIQQIRQGRHTVVCTQTASGKSLIYTIPILERLVADPHACALYLAPRKALAEDQFAHLLAWGKKAGEQTPSHIDGFAPLRLQGQTVGIGLLAGEFGVPRYLKRDQTKELIYRHGRFWLTNVHYLHLILRGIVDFRQKKRDLARFLQHLHYVVIDELHQYSGIFGSKVAMVLRRLRMLCERLGNRQLTFIACSATIANPVELAEELTGKKGIQGFHLVTGEAVPQKRKDLFLWNPGKAEQEEGKRRAVVSDLYDILRTLYRGGRYLRTLIFVHQRQTAHTLSRELNIILKAFLHQQQGGTSLPDDLFLPYHAHLPLEKRLQIMRRLQQGELLGLVATNALEVGIDIDHLDVCILLGYPGSQSSFWQQAGRVGRRRPGLVVLLWQEEPLQQYFARFPEAFLQKPPESAVISVSNAKLLREHLRYAAHEQKGTLHLPQNYFRASVLRQVREGTNEWNVTGGQWIYQGEAPYYRTLIHQGESFTVVAKTGWQEKLLYQGVDPFSLIRDYFVGAIFPGSDNETFYQVKWIDGREKKVVAVPVKSDYYTRGMIRDTIDICETAQTAEHSLGQSHVGTVLVKRYSFGYKKIYFTGSRKREAELVPSSTAYPVTFLTEAFWIQWREEGKRWIKEALQALRSSTHEPFPSLAEASLHAAEHAIAAAIPAVIQCNPTDFRHVSTFAGHLFDGSPGMIFYDSQSGGGSGIVEAIMEKWDALLEKGYQLLASCPCAQGCPSCLQLSHCERENEPLHKEGGVLLLQRWLESKEGEKPSLRSDEIRPPMVPPFA